LNRPGGFDADSSVLPDPDYVRLRIPYLQFRNVVDTLVKAPEYLGTLQYVLWWETRLPWSTTGMETPA